MSEFSKTVLEATSSLQSWPPWGKGWSSVVECLPSVGKALSSIPSPSNKQTITKIELISSINCRLD